MEFLSGAWDYVVPFLVVLTILVFVHELGHFIVARRCGVRVDVFSIGFGPELFGWNDRHGTRWKISALPLGGYVRMFGEHDAGGELPPLSQEDRASSFAAKPLAARAAVVAAGPVANFAFAIVVFTILFATAGEPFTPPVVGGVQENSAAALAGIQPGDRFVTVAGQGIDRFEEIQMIVRDNPGVPLPIVVDRGGKEVPLTVTPQTREDEDRFGNTYRIGFLGVTGGARQFVRHGVFTAAGRAFKETYSLSVSTLTAVGQMIAGTRTADDLGGPLRIAQMSGEVAQVGVVSLIWFLAVLSINLGLVNLFPVPVLDGGHLLFYAAEAIRGKPLGPKAQAVGFQIGLALVVGLMVFATWNDLMHLKVFEFLKKLVT
jgi:regulator of sigma E protease